MREKISIEVEQQIAIGMVVSTVFRSGLPLLSVELMRPNTADIVESRAILKISIRPFPGKHREPLSFVAGRR